MQAVLSTLHSTDIVSSSAALSNFPFSAKNFWYSDVNQINRYHN